MLVRALQTLKGQKSAIFRWTLVGLLLSSVVVWLTPPRYESTARVIPPESRPGLFSELLGSLQSSPVTDALALSGGSSLRSSGPLFVEILSSRTVQDRLVDRFDLRDVYGVGLNSRARKRLGQNTEIREDAKSGVISVVVSDRSAVRARDIANGYLEELDAFLVRTNASAAHRERQFLQNRLVEAKQELDKASQQLSKFSSENYAINLPEQGKALFAESGTLQGQIIALQSELEGLQQIYSDSSVRVRTTRARIDELQRQLAALGGSSASLQSKDAQQASYPSMRRLPELALTFSDLYRDTKIKESVLETLTKQYEVARIEEAKEMPTARILDYPDLPERPSSAPLLLIFAYTLLCFLLICGIVLTHAIWGSWAADEPRRQLVQSVLTATGFPWILGRIRSIRNGS